MPEEPIIPLRDHWVEQLRHELEVFDPSRATLCDQRLKEYYKLYQFNRMPNDVDYSAGFHWLSDTQLFIQYFRCKFAKGTVVLVHGYTDHSGLYGHLIEHLVRNQWNVFTYDLPGHGVSSGEALAIDSFDQYVAQLQNLLNHYRASFVGPVVMMGQSMGGSIVLSFLAASSAQQKKAWSISGSVMLAPMIRPADYDWMNRLYPFFYWWLGRLKRRFAQSSHNQAFLDFRSQRDPLQHHYISMKWIGAMLKWVKRIESASALEDGALIIQGTGDQTVNWQHNVQQLERLCPQAQWCVIEGARHHLVNESKPFRKQVFDAVDEYLVKHAKNPIPKRFS